MWSDALALEDSESTRSFLGTVLFVAHIVPASSYFSISLGILAVVQSLPPPFCYTGAFYLPGLGCPVFVLDHRVHPCSVKWTMIVHSSSSHRFFSRLKRPITLLGVLGELPQEAFPVFGIFGISIGQHYVLDLYVSVKSILTVVLGKYALEFHFMLVVHSDTKD